MIKARGPASVLEVEVAVVLSRIRLSSFRLKSLKSTQKANVIIES